MCPTLCPTMDTQHRGHPKLFQKHKVGTNIPAARLLLAQPEAGGKICCWLRKELVEYPAFSKEGISGTNQRGSDEGPQGYAWHGNSPSWWEPALGWCKAHFQQ